MRCCRSFRCAEVRRYRYFAYVPILVIPNVFLKTTAGRITDEAAALGVGWEFRNGFNWLYGENQQLAKSREGKGNKKKKLDNDKANIQEELFYHSGGSLRRFLEAIVSQFVHFLFPPGDLYI